MAAAVAFPALSPVGARADNRGAVTYFGGPVMHHEKTYAIFWDPHGDVGSRTRNLLTRYLKDVAHDSGRKTNEFSVLTQYTDKTHHHAAYKQKFRGARTDTRHYPSNPANCPVSLFFPSGTTCLTDIEIRHELSRYIAAHSLPRGLGALYTVFTPKNVQVCDVAPAGEYSGGCSPGPLCAWHSHIGAGKHAVIYAVVPFGDPPTAPDTLRYTHLCGLPGGKAKPQEPNGNVADLAINLLSHEIAESITNPLVGPSFVGHNKPAWQGSNQGEVADRCEHAGDPNIIENDHKAFKPVLGGSAKAGTQYTERINGHRYYTQSIWSNATNACRMRKVK